MAATSSGTVQGIQDKGCQAHDPSLYAHSSLAESLGALPTDASSTAAALENYHRDGFVVFTETPFSSHALGKALDELTDGTNQAFKKDFEQATSKDTPPDFTSGAKIPWCQYEAGTNVSNGLLRPEIAPHVRKLMGFVGYSPIIDSVVNHENLLSLVAQLLECEVDEVELFQDMALLKPPSGGREKPWHQDKAYFNTALSTKVVGCWIAVDAATCDNGCLRMMRGGHLGGPMMHFAKRDYQICDSDAPTRENVVAVELPPGGLVLFDGMIPHGTPTNSSQHKRRALQFHWVQRGAPRVDPDELGGRVSVFGGAAHNLSC